MNQKPAPGFSRYIGIDYSGAKTPQSSLRGLRVYRADRDAPPAEVPPPPSPRLYWSRKEVAEWLALELAQGPPAVVGIDHGFSFPLQYFHRHGLPHDWPAFLVDFQEHWPADKPFAYVDFIRDGIMGNAAARSGSSRWRRVCELRSKAAKSVFHFDVPGSVAKSTHAGLPWILYLRRALGNKVHCWPFDGWDIPKNTSVLAEMYPSMWNRQCPREDRTPDQHDAWTLARWLRDTDRNGALAACFHPALAPKDQAAAEIEGWILGLD